jgi:lipoyl(octanoyl) transferase
MIIWQKIDTPTQYNKMLSLMESKVDEVISGRSPETIFLTEHEDVYTAGTNAKANELIEAHFPVIHSGRGGKFTYHGPGIRIIYPIINLNNREKDLRAYIKHLEHWIINTLAHLHIKAYLIPGRVGIWTLGPKGESKIGAIGVRVKKWVTYHGIAVNISPDLSKFSGIIPCGINDAHVTSLQELGVNISLDEFDEILKKHYPF